MAWGTYDRVFGGERIHVLPMELLERNEENSLSRLCDFLDVRHVPYCEEAKNYNTGRDIDDLRWARRRNISFLRRWMASLRGHSPMQDDGTILGTLCRVYTASNARLSARLGRW